MQSLDLFLKNLSNYWLYWVVLIATILESSPIFGLLVPGQTIVIIAGFLVKLQIIDFWDTVIIAFLGAFSGDLIGYFLGRKYGYSFLSHYGKYFFFKQEGLEKTKKLVNKHAGKTIIIGRFNSLTRAFAPFVAGSSNLPFFKFIFYNLIGGISWALLFVFVGYVFGESYEIASVYIGRFITIAIIVSLLLAYLYKSLNKRKSMFTKYHLHILAVNIFSLFVFLKIIDDIIDRKFITKIDFWITQKIVLLWNPLITKIMSIFSNIAKPEIIIALLFVFASIFAYKKEWHKSLIVFFSVTLSAISGFLIKEIIQRQRPENSLIIASGYSFPSGHAIMSVIFFLLNIYLFKNKIKNNTLKYSYICLNLFMILFIGFNRIYLNVHWFSDVIAGFALGVFCLTFSILFTKAIFSFYEKKIKTLDKKFL